MIFEDKEILDDLIVGYCDIFNSMEALDAQGDPPEDYQDTNDSVFSAENYRNVPGRPDDSYCDLACAPVERCLWQTVDGSYCPRHSTAHSRSDPKPKANA